MGSDADIVAPDEFAQLPSGAEARLIVVGHCMVPAIWSGDHVDAVRCGPGGLAAGDVVIVRHDEGFRAHLLIEPIAGRTGTLAGRLDEGAIEIIGIVTHVRRGRHAFKLSERTRAPLLAVFRVSRFATESGLRARIGRGRDALLSSTAIPPLFRGVSSRFEVRKLTLADAPKLAIFCGLHRIPEAPEVLRALRTRWISATGISVGAFDQRGRLCAVGAAEVSDPSTTTARVVFWHVHVRFGGFEVGERIRQSLRTAARTMQVVLSEEGL